MLDLTAYELAQRIESGEISAREAAEAANDRVEEVENDVNAFVTTTPELALDRADRIDERLKNGGIKLWEGVPVAVKDVLSTRGVRTTSGSKILEDFEPLYDASALKNFGEDMVVVGKANCDEFAMGSSTENSAYGPTRNPWDLGRVPGWLLRRFGGGGGVGRRLVGAGDGYGGFGASAGGTVRHRGAQAYLRACFEERAHRLRVFAGPGRAPHPRRPGRGALAPGNRRPMIPTTRPAQTSKCQITWQS